MAIVDHADAAPALPAADVSSGPGPDSGVSSEHRGTDHDVAGAVPRPVRPGRPGRGRLPRAVVLVTALHVTLLLAYSFMYTTWTGYDEAQHVDVVYGLQNGGGWPAPGQRIMAKGVTATSDDFDRGRYAEMFQAGGKSNGEPAFAEMSPTPRGQRLSFDALGGPGPVTDGRLSNQMVQHPPLVYAIAAAGLAALPGSSGWAYDKQVWVLRLLNIIIVAPLPLLAWAAARRIGLSEALAQAAATVPLAVPGLTRVGATFNNDGLLMLSVGGLTVVLAGVLRGDMRRRTAAAAGLLLAVAFLTKALALPLMLMVLAAYLAGWTQLRGGRRLHADPTRPLGATPAHPWPRTGATAGRTRGPRGIALALRTPPWGPALLAIGLACAAGGWWWVRNYILYHAVQPNGWATEPPRREPVLLPRSFFTWYDYFWRTIISRFWGGLGMFEPPRISGVAVVVATVVVAGCIIAAVRPAVTDSPTAERIGRFGRLGMTGQPLVLLMPIFLAYLLVGQRSYSDYGIYTRAIAIQGRYLYMGIVGLAVVVAVGLGRLLNGRDTSAGLLVLISALLMQAVAVWTVCGYYWLPRGESWPLLHIGSVVTAIARWAPFPEGVTIAVFVLCPLLAYATVAATVRATRRSAGQQTC